MEVIADFLMEVLPTSIGDWLSEHFFVWLLKKVKNKALRTFIALVALLLIAGVAIGAALLIIISLMMLLK